MKHTLFPLALILTAPLLAKTVRYSGSTALDDGQTFTVEAIFETATEYQKPKQASEEYEQIDYDVHVAEPYVCTRTLTFDGPKLTFKVRTTPAGDPFVRISETVGHIASLEKSAQRGWNCPKWEEFDGYRGRAITSVPAGFHVNVGQYRGSRLTLSMPSVMLWESDVRVSGQGKAQKMHDIKVKSDTDSKTGWFSYFPDPKLNRETTFGEFKIYKEGEVAFF